MNRSNMDRLTLTFLNRYNACKEGITFVKNNNLLNFPFELLDQVKGDHDEYITWLKECIDGVYHYKDSEGNESWKEYDENNNLIHYKDSNGNEYSNEIEYYPDGQLKKYNELELPYFEKITT